MEAVTNAYEKCIDACARCAQGVEEHGRLKKPKLTAPGSGAALFI